MTRLLKLATIIFTIISLTSAQFVDTLNTPLGPVTQGANVQVSWTLLPGVDATGKNGDLTAVDSASKNTIEINNQVPLAPKSFTWNVQVPPGKYTLGLNDGSGLKQSGEVEVRAAAGGTNPAPGTSPAPGGPAPAPSGGASSPAPPAGSPSAGGAAPSAGASTPSGGASAGGAGGSGSAGGSAGGAGGAGGAATTTGGSSSSASTPPPVSSPSSASSIISGYKIVFSLLGVAIAMVQF